MRYEELLQRHEWIEKSAAIIQRDSFRCQACGSLGFHSRSMLICKDAQELDKRFDGWTFNGLTFSAFLEKEKQSSSNYTECVKSSVTPLYETNNNGYSCFRIWSACTADIRHDVDRTAYCCCRNFSEKNQILYSRHFRDISANCYGKGLEIEKGENERIHLDWGDSHVLSLYLTDTYVVSIEYIYPTGVVGDDYGACFYGSIIISITYKNLVTSLYFNPKEMKGLNVHHKYYIKGNAPWEYEDDALITLCEDCHKKAHKFQTPVFCNVNSARMLYGNAITCNRCNGSGYLHQYDHVENGICFRCWGEGVVLDTLE